MAAIGWDCGRDVGIWWEVIGLKSEASLKRLERAGGWSAGHSQEEPGKLQGHLLHLERVAWSRGCSGVGVSGSGGHTAGTVEWF